MEDRIDSPGAGTLVLRGLSRGALAGAGLAVSYTSLATTAFLLVVAAGGRDLGNPGAFVVGSGVAAFAWIFAVFLGIIPAAILGGVAGLAIGAVSAVFGRRLTPRISGWIGFLAGAVVVCLLHLTLGISLLKSGGPGTPLLPWFFWVGGPSPFLLAGTTWMGWSLLRPLGSAVWPFRQRRKTG
ncbi:MAG: hypothetical protein IT186_15460 [Acidobacteria bacterium]|nr:hypothetical protein [Acidobacteriota bacterium]